MEADVGRFWHHRGPSAWQGKCQWIKREMVKNILNIKKDFLIIKFHNDIRPLDIFLTIYLYVLRITINITKILQLTTLSSYMKSFGQIFFRLATRSMVY